MNFLSGIPGRTCTRKAQRLPQFTLQEFQRIFPSPVPAGAEGSARASPALKICMENGKNADASTAVPPLMTSRRFKTSFFSDDLLSGMVPPQNSVQFRGGLAKGRGGSSSLIQALPSMRGGVQAFVGEMVALWFRLPQRREPRFMEFAVTRNRAPRGSFARGSVP